MKKKTGFTLIELLAVIIILAIIALIATPIVLNVVEESKETARRSSISGYASGVRYAAYDNGYVLTGKLPEVNKEWAESNVEVSGDKVECEEVRYSTTYETVLHKCRVGKSEKEYYFAGGKVYEDPEDAEYKAIYDSVNVVEPNLAQELIKQYQESNTVGLLKDDTGYYYKGSSSEVANNFVWFGGHLWRVISIDKANNLTMITQQPITSISPASSVWTTEQQYKESYINTWLNEVFLGSMETTDKDKIQNNTFNIGINTDVSEITTTQKAGLLDESQYDKAGGQNSFLDIKNTFWLGNRQNNDVIYWVVENGTLHGDNPYYSDYGVRPVTKTINLAFIDGKGTIDDPYRDKSVTTNTTNIKVGEYISIPTSGDNCGEDNRCLFRVVSKDNNSIKVILNGLLSTTSAFDSNNNATYTSGNTIDTIVTNFVKTISDIYRYKKTDKSFGIGVYGDGTNYKDVQNTTYSGNVGLPVIGEMFTANDINMVSPQDASKSFVNVATIENPTISLCYWTMNAKSASATNFMMYNGSFGNSAGTGESFGVRPVLFLNNNLQFTSGEGTAENPFVLE